MRAKLKSDRNREESGLYVNVSLQSWQEDEA